MTNIENKSKEIRSIVASYAVCGNASWTVIQRREHQQSAVSSSGAPHEQEGCSSLHQHFLTFYVPQTPCIATCNIANRLANIFQYGLCHVRLLWFRKWRPLITKPIEVFFDFFIFVNDVRLVCFSLIPVVQQHIMGQDLLIIEASRTHSDTPQFVGRPWTSDQPDAETFTSQPTLTKDRHPWPRGNSNPQSQKAIGRRPTP